jgi:CheY-like chemotaxis protein
MKDKKKILLVDDNHDILDLLEVFLYDDFEITSVLNGFEGLKIAEEILPDLIITDIMMPVMDGIKFLNNLRKKPKVAGVPVIAVTSFAKKLNIKSLLNMGFNGVVSKPFSREEILAVIVGIFDKK